MEYESETITCGICGHNNTKLLTLSGQEQVLVGKLFQCISLNRRSRTACDLCLRKLYSFKNFLKAIIVNQVKLERTHERKMQQDPKKVADENKDEEEHIDTINCRCSDCQSKFGSLPLLVEVIEQNEDKTEKNLDEPQPSTSHDVSPKTSRKFMKCVHCEKKFTHKGDLNKHMRKHTGEQPFTCSVCDRKFAHTSNLARHMRLHSGDRPFSCEICNKNFSRKDKLELHRKSKCCKKTS